MLWFCGVFFNMWKKPVNLEKKTTLFCQFCSKPVHSHFQLNMQENMIGLVDKVIANILCKSKKKEERMFNVCIAE